LLRNSNGGFLLLEQEDDPKIARQRRLEEERKAQRLKEAERLGLMQDPHLDPDRSKNAQCRECGTIELDFLIHKVFGVPVCNKCKQDHPDKYSLLTKTECKEDYLLTDRALF
jgi:DNA-repair protein complementing XP-A cells